jgi:hypothetical protein
MRIRRTFLGLLFAALGLGSTAVASGRPAPAPTAVLTNVIARLDREASIDSDGGMFLADLIEKAYGTREDELKWGLDRKVSWGDMTALAYIQATTGKSFEEMIQENARHDFYSYAENVGMSCDKMLRSLDDFLKRAERERNTRIFERLRASRRVYPMPDLGNGFGLFQEALDFRHIDTPQPTKIHGLPGELAKGGQ